MIRFTSFGRRQILVSKDGSLTKPIVFIIVNNNLEKFEAAWSKRVPSLNKMKVNRING